MEIIFFIFHILTGIVFLKTVINLSKKSNFTKKNYKGEIIPKSLGIVLLLNIILGLILRNIFLGWENTTFSISIILVGVVGLLDDIFGNEEVKGFKQHIKKFFSGEITTGFLKAIFIFLISTWAVISYPYPDKIIFVDILIITLFSNFFNLLDLRPSRAIKVFLLLFFILAEIFIKNFYNKEFFLEWLPLLTAIIVIIPFDFRGKAMLGDTGSNILGFSIGFITVQACNDFYKIIILVFLVIFHLFCEKYSLSEVIDKNKFLRYIDKLGT